MPGIGPWVWGVDAQRPQHALLSLEARAVPGQRVDHEREWVIDKGGALDGLGDAEGDGWVDDADAHGRLDCADLCDAPLARVAEAEGDALGDRKLDEEGPRAAHEGRAQQEERSPERLRLRKRARGEDRRCCGRGRACHLELRHRSDGEARRDELGTEVEPAQQLQPVHCSGGTRSRVAD